MKVVWLSSPSWPSSQYILLDKQLIPEYSVACIPPNLSLITEKPKLSLHSVSAYEQPL